jgi:uncharacterized protein YndB with AHSA1/START domain
VSAGNDSNRIRLTRVYAAPLRAVWDAWTIPEQIEKWWGPRGFTLTTHSKDLRPGGTWRYTMHGPDGVDYPNLATYHVVEPHKTLVYDHGATDDSPPLFHVTATFSEAQGRTTLDLVFTFATAQVRAEMESHIKKAGGNATWDRLAEHLEEGISGKRCFVIHRTLAAPIVRVFQMWTDPAHLPLWLPPAGMRMRFLRATIAVGQSTFFVMEGQHGTMHVRAEYLVLEAPHRIVYQQRFVDAREQLAPAPGAPVWPPTLLMTVLLSEEAPDRTRITLTCEPHGDATAAELGAFVQERSGMTKGWTGSFDALEALLS